MAEGVISWVKLKPQDVCVRTCPKSQPLTIRFSHCRLLNRALWSLDKYSLPPASSQAFGPVKAFSCCLDAIRLAAALGVQEILSWLKNYSTLVH